MSAFQALVLAGSRGPHDPVAAYAGVTHKALIPLGGRTLIARVVDALAEAGATRIAVSANDPAITAGLTGVEPIAAEAGPSLSVRAAVERLGTPLLVTTADHALLRPEWVRRFLEDVPAGTDVAALLARRDVVEAAAPATRRTYLKFRDGEWSGCNLFLLAGDRALAAVDLWRRVEVHRKQPWRIAALLGPDILLGYALGRLTLAEAVARLGRKAGATARAVATPYGLAAVDVDKPADLDLVRRIVEA